jgi:hypothetical protein
MHEELAHWRYRAGALERELEWLRKQCVACNQLAYWRFGGGVLAEPNQVYIDKATAYQQQIKDNEYLLEEARYRIELVTVTTEQRDEKPLPLGDVDHTKCRECGDGIYRHSSVPWLHTDTGLRWCYRDPDDDSLARP